MVVVAREFRMSETAPRRRAGDCLGAWPCQGQAMASCSLASVRTRSWLQAAHHEPELRPWVPRTVVQHGRADFSVDLTQTATCAPDPEPGDEIPVTRDAHPHEHVPAG